MLGLLYMATLVLVVSESVGQQAGASVQTLTSTGSTKDDIPVASAPRYAEGIHGMLLHGIPSVLTALRESIASGYSIGSSTSDLCVSTGYVHHHT